MQFYAVANNEKSTKVITLESTNRFQAENEAAQMCNKQGLYLEGVYFVKGTGKQGSTLTKKAEKRKKDRGMGKVVDFKF